MSDGLAPDGSPVDVYLALPPGETPDIIHSALRPGSSILELGSGPGRITHELVRLGHVLVAVDDSPEMLSHVRGAETVHADLFTLALGRQFDAVLAGSHLINSPEPERRLQLLDVCRRHIVPDGVVLVERYAPGWALAPSAGRSEIGGVLISFEPLEVSSSRFRGRVTYELAGRVWAQEFEGAEVGDERLAGEAREVGLRVSRWLDEARTWSCLVRDH